MVARGLLILCLPLLLLQSPPIPASTYYTVPPSYPPASSARLRCFIGRSDYDRPPQRSYVCPRHANFCYKSYQPQKRERYEWGCASSWGCVESGCETVDLRVLNEKILACCCATSLCNSANPSTPPLPFLLPLLWPLSLSL